MIPDLNLRDGIHIPARTVEGFLWGGIERGIRWLEELPTLVETICQKHDITDLRPSPEMRMNLVLFGESSTHGPIVIKLAPPHWEVSNEIAALRLHQQADHYVELIDADETAAWSLQVRVEPGTMLQTIVQTGDISDEAATSLAADMMQKTVQPVSHPLGHAFPDLTTWLSSLWKYADSGDNVLPADQVELAIRFARSLTANPGAPMLLHGDFHHGNILQSETGWMVIDPKGIVAEKAFEVGPFFYNPIGIDKHPDLIDIFNRRLDIFPNTLGIDRVQLWKCALVACVLSDCWSLEDGPVDHLHFDTVTAALMQLPERLA